MLETVMAELTGTFSVIAPEVAAVRLVAALLLGGAIGLEREWRNKPAGLRTHMLVSLAACLFILISQQLSSVTFGSSEHLRVDPLRLIEAVTAGVAFLAAGIIFSSRSAGHHTATGASMWLAGAIGLGCGSGQIPLSVMAAVIVIALLLGLRYLEHWMGTH